VKIRYTGDHDIIHSTRGITTDHVARLLAETMVSHLRMQSSHPAALLFLYRFRTGAITAYVLWGWFTGNYVLPMCHEVSSLRIPTPSPHRPRRSSCFSRQTSGLVGVPAISSIILLLIYVTLQNISGSTLVGLRFWNQVDEYGESSRDVQDSSEISITVLNRNSAS
jgi:hypothetical protein